jgi:O-acetylhomoserine/O-acetylserine sulfhydrylase-like pyridoxal-dependent enzyme
MNALKIMEHGNRVAAVNSTSAIYRAYAGDGVIRLSIRLEAVDDLIGDVDQALRN